MSRGRARLAISEGLAAWLLEAPEGFGDAAFHAHHAVQLTVSFSGSLSLTCDGETLTGKAIAVASDAQHKFAAEGLLGFVFVEPESRLGSALTERLFHEGPMALIGDEAFARAIEPLRRALDAPLSHEAMLGVAREAVEALAGETAPALPDGRVLRIIEYAAANPELSLDQAAAGAGVHLSPSRLRHLFVEQTGLAFKTYMLWQRLVRALQCYADGHSLTEAAHHASFADSAHFSRAFKRTFGLPATTLTRI